ncbi:MAG: M56 family metallopeptidase, partial [Thermoanaerobaculia bacterium]|nr:M56 family metallopeptidase [Thermoanaerobaculia bacterium]
EVIMIDDHLGAATGGTPWRPKLYLSENLAESLDRNEVEAVLRHEYAHLRPSRWWTVHVLFVARILQAHNPVALWVSREYSVETEIECDREAVRDEPRDLARVLFAIHQEIGGNDPVRRRVLERRIDVLLGRSPEAHRVARLPSLALSLSGIVMATLLPWVT